MTPERRAAIEALLAAVTQNEWVQDTSEPAPWFIQAGPVNEYGRAPVVATVMGPLWPIPEGKSEDAEVVANRALIIQCRPIIRELLDELDTSDGGLMRDSIPPRITNAQRRALSDASPELAAFITQLLDENERLQRALASAVMDLTDRPR